MSPSKLDWQGRFRKLNNAYQAKKVEETFHE